MERSYQTTLSNWDVLSKETSHNRTHCAIPSIVAMSTSYSCLNPPSVVCQIFVRCGEAGEMRKKLVVYRPFALVWRIPHAAECVGPYSGEYSVFLTEVGFLRIEQRYKMLARCPGVARRFVVTNADGWASPEFVSLLDPSNVTRNA